MKNRGFTLIEMIAAVVILSIIALIVIPIVNKNIKESRTKLYDKQVKTIEDSAQRWVVSNDITNIPCVITLDSLKTDGFLEKGNTYSPKDESVMAGCVAVVYDNDYKQNTYTYGDCPVDPTYCTKRGSN